MALRVSTTGTDVAINDLGIIVTHPTTNRDLAQEFTAIELKDSLDLTAAIQSGTLDADDGSHFVAADDYDPDQNLIDELGIRPDRFYISHDELASKNDILIVSGIFPVSLSSTASVTRNVYSPSGRWITWQADVDDYVVITGSTAADGIYTIESVTDQQNFIVVESIPNSTGGTVDIYHPNAPTIIGTDDSNFTTVSGNNLQEVLESIDFKLGLTAANNIVVQEEGATVTGGPHGTLNFVGADVTATDGGGGVATITVSGISGAGEPHRPRDELVHKISEDSYEEYTRVGLKVTNITVWTNSSKTTKIRETQFVYTGLQVNTITTIQYNGAGVEVERQVETVNSTGVFVDSIDRDLI